MKISQISSLGILTLAGAIALPAAAATQQAGAQPPRPAANRSVAPKPTNSHLKTELENTMISSAKAPNKPTGNSQTNTQSGGPGNGAPGNGKVKKPPGPGAFTDPDYKSPEDNRVVSPRDVASGQATGITSPRDPASGLPTGKTGK